MENKKRIEETLAKAKEEVDNALIQKKKAEGEAIHATSDREELMSTTRRDRRTIEELWKKLEAARSARKQGVPVMRVAASQTTPEWGKTGAHWSTSGHRTQILDGGQIMNF